MSFNAARGAGLSGAGDAEFGIIVAGDEGCEAGLMPFGPASASLIVIEIPDAEQRRARRGTPRTWPGWSFVEMDDVFGGNPAAGQALENGRRVAGVGAVEPVGDAAADGVELDAVENPAAIRQDFVLEVVDIVRPDDLHLQRDSQAIFRAAVAQADLDSPDSKRVPPPGQSGRRSLSGRRRRTPVHHWLQAAWPSESLGENLVPTALPTKARQALAA